MKEINIGRASDNDIVLDDKTVSRNHAFLFGQSSQWFISDKGSTHGTYVNNSIVEGRVELKPGDKVKFSDIEFVFSGNCLRYPDGEILVNLALFEPAAKKARQKTNWPFTAIVIGIISILALLAFAIDKYIDLPHSKFSQSPTVEETIYRGTIIFQDGEYTGALKDGLPHGYGVLLYSMPKRSLAFSDIMAPRKRQKYSGHWQNGLKHGEGVMTFPDGSSVGGFWKNDIYIGTTE